VPIQRVSIPSIAIETNKNNINLKRHLKWNLKNIPGELNKHGKPIKRKAITYMFQIKKEGQHLTIVV